MAISHNVIKEISLGMSRKSQKTFNTPHSLTIKTRTRCGVIKMAKKRSFHTDKTYLIELKHYLEMMLQHRIPLTHADVKGRNDLPFIAEGAHSTENLLHNVPGS